MGFGQDKIIANGFIKVVGKTTIAKSLHCRVYSHAMKRKILARTLGITGKLQNTRQKKQLQHMEELRS